MVVFAAGSAAAALSSSPSELITFRAVMGLGGAFVMPATLSIINAVFPRAERAKAIGAWSAVSGIAVVVGPTVGGFLLAHSSWHSVFWINVPLALVTLIAVALVVPSSTSERKRGGAQAGQRLDVLGAVSSAVGMLAVVDAVIEAPARGWTSPLTLGEAALGLAAFAGFVAHELRTAHPLIDVRVFSHRAFSAASAAVALTFFAMFGSLFALTQYLQLVHGYSPLSAGLRALPFAAGVLLAAPLAPALVARLGTRVVIPAGLASMATGLFALSAVTATSGLLHVSIAVAMMGAGMGLVLAPAGESILSVLPEEQAGVGSALNDTVQELGGSLGVAVLGSLVSVAYGQHLTDALHATAAAHLPAAVLSPARSSIAAADAVAANLHTHNPALADALTTSAHTAFTTAMTHGFTIAAAVAAAGAIAGALTLPAHNRREDATTPASAAPIRTAIAAAPAA
jgi:EmrB/QacA subfamily drug resistance transporter